MKIYSASGFDKAWSQNPQSGQSNHVLPQESATINTSDFDALTSNYRLTLF